eukprot:3631963-Prorocentrum_lima.AAC.1
MKSTTTSSATGSSRGFGSKVTASLPTQSQDVISDISVPVPTTNTPLPLGSFEYNGKLKDTHVPT